jgi:hypothetical protein
MKTTTTWLVVLLTMSTLAFAQKTADTQAIKGQCGCHQVTFEYAETFSSDPNYKFHDRKKTKGLEWVFVDEESKDKLVLMHLLVIDSNTVIKHWREDWLFENTDLLAYQQGSDWKSVQLPKNQVKGQWTQKVFEVNDAPRYEGSASWFHRDGQHVWTNTSDAPLPRREYTTRSDYNVLRRQNRIHLTPTGYIHEQDNDKVLRTETGDKVLVQEKGLNAYTRVDNSKCAIAKTWWEQHRAFWLDVRAVWQEIFDRKTGVSLKTEKVENKSLFQAFDELSAMSERKKWDSGTNREKIRTTLAKYLNNKPLVGLR